MPHSSVNPRQRARAKSLRQTMTRAETLLWRYLKAHRLDDLGFRRQAPMGPYIVDFVCHDRRLVVELDGESHDFEERLKRDCERDVWLATEGYLVMRYTNREVLSNLEGVVTSIAQTARERGIPYLGVCLGMQIAVIEYARNVCGLEGANSSEFDPETPYPVIDLLPEQKGIDDLGATMRLGAAAVDLVEGTRAHAAYRESVIQERHRHRYEVNNAFRQQLVDAGLVVAGTFREGRLVEMIELPDHPWFVASQFHPEFKSRPTRPAPLFREFVGAARERSRSRTALASTTRS